MAFITALANYNQKEARRVVYFFLIYYGLTFVISNPYVDAARYAATLKENANLPFSQFFNIVGGIYATDTSIDIVEPFLSFMVSRFTSFHGVLFAVFAAVFGYFYLKSINLLYYKHIQNPNINSVIFIIFFILILPITNINGFRMWTAAWMFFYGAYQVVVHRKTNYFLLTFSAVIVHFSFISANAILLIYYFMGNRNIIYIPLLLGSFIVPNIVSPIFRIAATRLGGAFESRYEGYSSENYIRALQSSAEQASWFIVIGRDMVVYFLLFSMGYIFLKLRNEFQEKSHNNIFSFTILFLAFVNFAKIIPSFGSRFQIIFFMFATLYILIYIINQSDKKIHILTLLGVFPMLLYSSIVFRIGSESINLWLFSPVFGLPLLSSGIPLSEILFN